MSTQLTKNFKIDIIFAGGDDMKEKEPTINLTLRIPISLKIQIEIEANKDSRTVNSLVNKILTEHFNTKKN